MTEESNTGAAPASSDMTDEQIAAAFPDQDVASLRASMEKAEGLNADVSPNADATEGDTNVEYPDYIPEKFRNGTVDEAHAALAAAHKSLESKQGATADNNEGDGTDEGDEGEADAGETNTGTKMVLSDLESEYLENDGTISAETYAKMDTQGWDKSAVDGYISGQQALAAQLVTQVHQVAGGEESYTNMLKWATENWSSPEVDAFDDVMQTGNEAQITMAVRGLKATYEAEFGKTPGLLKGDGDKSQVNHGTYGSKAEMTADMKDPRYKTDPAWRAKVAAKLEGFDW